MPVVINTNYAASIAANNLSASNTSLQRSLNRLSSGSKIVSPSDDAGGLAVSMSLSAAAKRSGAAGTNIANSISLLQTQDGALKTAGKILDRMSELRTLYDDPTKNADDKANYDTEYTALVSQLTDVAGQKFNTIGLFAGATVRTSEDGLSSTVAIAARTTADWTGLSNLATDTITTINDAIKAVATQRATNGAEQSCLGYAAEMLTVNKTNLEAANSRIVDVDVADESTQLARYNVLVQSGTAMLAQANQSAQAALKLLQ